jgi:CheY-like chemotaxis protein
MQILIIEDDASIRDMLCECLADEGYDVAGARHGQEALDYLRTHQPLPDLLLLDMAMPVMNGWEFLAMWERDPHLARIPVVMLTAAANGYLQHDLPKQVQVVAKPVDINTLLELVARYRKPG